jgi:hypothetical protein
MALRDKRTELFIKRVRHHAVDHQPSFARGSAPVRVRNLLLQALVLMSIAAAGCSSERPPSSPSTPTSVQGNRPTITTGASPLTRRDVPPENVASQADFYIGGDEGPCGDFETASGPARIHLFQRTIESPSAVEVCLPGFMSGRAVTLVVTRSDRAVRRYAEPSLHDGGTEVFLLPGEPFGAYTITARQGKLHASSAFTVTPAKQPKLVLVTTGQRLGEPIKLAFGGFTPNAPARIHAYSVQDSGEARGRYVTSFKLAMDRYGQAMLTIPTRPGDPQRCYGFRWDGMQEPATPICLYA